MTFAQHMLVHDVWVTMAQHLVRRLVLVHDVDLLLLLLLHLVPLNECLSLLRSQLLQLLRRPLDHLVSMVLLARRLT